MSNIISLPQLYLDVGAPGLNGLSAGRTAGRRDDARARETRRARELTHSMPTALATIVECMEVRILIDILTQILV